MIEKKYLTFGELLARWGCEEKDIHYLISDGDLEPAIAWNGAVYVKEWQPNPDGGSILVDYKYPEPKDEWDDGSTERLSGWVYLRRPKVTGAYTYKFGLATKGARDGTDEFSTHWYGLAEYNERNGMWPTSINEYSIVRDAVFMMDEIELCEFIHPNLSAPTLRDAEIFNKSALSVAI